MSTTLTEYEERAVLEIAHWKAETPSRVARAFQVIRKPLNEVTGRVATGSKVRSLCARVESLVEPKAGRDEIARAAGVGAVEELADHSLEECDRLAEEVSVHAHAGRLSSRLRRVWRGLSARPCTCPFSWRRDPRDPANRPLLRLPACDGARPSLRDGRPGARDGGRTGGAAKHPRSAVLADARSEDGPTGAARRRACPGRGFRDRVRAGPGRSGGRRARLRLHATHRYRVAPGVPGAVAAAARQGPRHPPG